MKTKNIFDSFIIVHIISVLIFLCTFTVNSRYFNPYNHKCQISKYSGNFEKVAYNCVNTFIIFGSLKVHNFFKNIKLLTLNC